MVDLVMLGANGVGKTALVKQLCHNTFEERYQQTTGMLAYSYQNKQREKSFIWDLPLSKTYNDVRKNYFTDDKCFMLVIDVTKSQSDSIKQCIDFLDELSMESITPPEIPIYLIATKTDQKNKRQLSTQQIKDLAMTFNLTGSFECSAIEKTKIKTIFDSILSLPLNNEKKPEKTTENIMQATAPYDFYLKMRSNKNKILPDFIQAITSYLSQAKDQQAKQLRQCSLELYYAQTNNIIDADTIMQTIADLAITEQQRVQLVNISKQFSQLKGINASTGIANFCSSVLINKLANRTEKNINISQYGQINSAIAELEKIADNLPTADASVVKNITLNLNKETQLYFKKSSKDNYLRYQEKTDNIITAANKIFSEKAGAPYFSKVLYTLKSIKSAISSLGVIHGFKFCLETYKSRTEFWMDPQEEAKKKIETVRKLRNSIVGTEKNMANKFKQKPEIEQQEAFIEQF